MLFGMDKPQPPAVDIVESVVDRLKKTGLPASEIAKAAGVKERWLRTLMAGEIPNPGVRTFTQVTAFLDEHEKTTATERAN